MSELENENVESLTSATSSLPEEKTFIPTLKEEDELLEMNEDFDFENFQVVRREFFAHLSEPTVSFKNCKITINSACLSKFPDTMYTQALVSDNKKILAFKLEVPTKNILEFRNLEYSDISVSFDKVIKQRRELLFLTEDIYYSQYIIIDTAMGTVTEYSNWFSFEKAIDLKTDD